jgi:hypothetical protein
MKMTVKKIRGLTQGLWRNASCFFVSSRLKNRPPKLSKSIKIPTRYGFVFIELMAAEIGSRPPDCVVGPGGNICCGACVGGIGAEGTEGTAGACRRDPCIFCAAETGTNQFPAAIDFDFFVIRPSY